MLCLAPNAGLEYLNTGSEKAMKNSGSGAGVDVRPRVSKVGQHSEVHERCQETQDKQGIQKRGNSRKPYSSTYTD